MIHTQKIKGSVKRLYDVRNKRLKTEKECKAEEEALKREISNYMFCNVDEEGKPLKEMDVLVDGGDGEDGAELAFRPVLFRVTKSKATKIVFIVEKLKERLDKALCKKVIKKRYEIVNMEGLKKYLKSCGVDPKKFKKYILVTEYVDYDMMEQLYEFGEIDIKGLKGCYDIKESKETISVKKLK